MTYSDFLQLDSSKKNTLFEIDTLIDISDNTLWITEEASIWKLSYSWDKNKVVDFSYGFGGWGFGRYGESLTSNLSPPLYSSILKLSSILADNTQLTLVNSLDDLRVLEGSFYFDKVNQIIYIHTVDGESPAYSYDVLELGITKGYSQRAGYLGELYYDSRIKSIPTISTLRDPLYYGKISFEGGSITLHNTDGYFDSFASENYYGTKVRLLFGGDGVDVADYGEIYTGYIESHNFAGTDITINFKDNRKLLSTSLPVNVYGTDTHPIIDELVGNPVPLGYGIINKAEAFSTAGDTFSFVDTSHRAIKAVTQVYVKNTPVVHLGESLIDGTITLAPGSYEEGDEVSVDFEGYVKDDNVTLIENPIDIIQDILTTYTQLYYSDVFFNTVEWEAARAASTKSIGILVEKNRQIIEIIGDISSSVFGLFTVQGDGRFSFSFRDAEADSSDTILIDEMLSPPQLDFVSTEYLNSVRVQYAPAWTPGTNRFYINNSKASELSKKYRSNVEQTFKTLLSKEADAIAFSTEVLDTFGGIFPTFTIETSIKHIAVNVGNIVELEVGKYDDLYKSSKLLRVEVLAKSVDLNNFTVRFTLRAVSSEYEGVNLVELIRYNSIATYQAGSVVSYSGQLWKAIDVAQGQPPQPTSEFWEAFGKLYWFNYVQYSIGDLVVHNGTVWQAISENLNSEPVDGANWEVFGGGSGSTEWRVDVKYDIGSTVIYQGKFYESLSEPNQGNQPNTNPSDWQYIQLNADTLDGFDSTYFLNTSTVIDADTLDGFDSTQFLRSDVTDTMTGNLNITGNVVSNSGVFAGQGSGGVAMTVNDGYGNANLTFNHASGKPDHDGNAGRIVVNTDASTNANMDFQLKSSVTSGAAVGAISVLNLSESQITANTKLKPVTGITMGTGAMIYEAGSLGYSDVNQGFLYRPPRAGIANAHLFENFAGDDILSLKEDKTSQFYGTVTATNFIGNVTGNASTATKLSTDRSTWADNGVIDNVVGQLAWKNFGNGHTIFDASQGKTPTGVTKSNTDPDVPWKSSYPTLMGYNGSNTYGVRVDIARNAENAYTLESLDSTQFLRSDVTDYFGSSAGNVRLEGTVKSGQLATTGSVAPLEIKQATPGADAFMTFHINGDYAAYLGLSGADNDFFVGGWSMGSGVKHKLWHEGNMGAGSGLDADKLDGVNSSQFLRSDIAATKTGNLTMAANSAIVSNTTATYDKFRVWSTADYAIGMTSGLSYGALGGTSGVDFAMTFTMASADTRGFLWRNSSHASSDGAMSLSLGGDLTVKKSVSLNSNAKMEYNTSTNSIDFIFN